MCCDSRSTAAPLLVDQRSAAASELVDIKRSALLTEERDSGRVNTVWPTLAHIKANNGKIRISKLKIWKDIHLRSVQVTLSNGEESPIF